MHIVPRLLLAATLCISLSTRAQAEQPPQRTNASAASRANTALTARARADSLRADSLANARVDAIVAAKLDSLPEMVAQQVSLVTASSPDWLPWWLLPALAGLALALAGGALTVAMQVRKERSRTGSVRGAPSYDPANFGGANAVPRGFQGAQKDGGDDSEMRRRIDGLEQRLDKMTSAAMAIPTPNPTSSSMSAKPGPKPAPPPAQPKSPGEQVGQAFAEWCSEATALVSRVHMFQNRLREVLPEAMVESIYRDANAAAVSFLATPPPDPAEYWLVRVGDHRLLLPQPTSGGQFREVDVRCFGGKAPAPSAVRRVRPAVMAESGPGAVTLQRAGEIA